MFVVEDMRTTTGFRETACLQTVQAFAEGGRVHLSSDLSDQEETLL